jgi:nitroreductase
MKHVVKKLIPTKLLTFIRKQVLHRASAIRQYIYDIDRYIRHSNAFFVYQHDTQEKIKAKLTINYHIIEKGLTMPDTRLGFGENAIYELLFFLNEYLKNKYSREDMVFKHSIMVLNEYIDFHRKQEFELKADIVAKITAISSQLSLNEQKSAQIFVSNNDFFEKNYSPFDEFCSSRHSVRHFSDREIELDTLYKCIELAQKSPSACNRQPNRIYVVQNKDKISEILKIQSGNRGFGHLSKALLVITVELSAFIHINERNEPHFNSGFFTMSLLYALHFHKLGACALNWSASRKNDKRMRDLLNIPDSQTVTVVIACGYLPENFKVARSPKMPAKEITTEVL